jgi:hypothetical protein
MRTGHCIEAHFTVDGDVVTLTDAEGAPIRNSWGTIVSQRAEGASPRVIASRLALRRWRADQGDMADFNRPTSSIAYQKWRY